MKKILKKARSLMNIATSVSEMSKDRNTKVGALIVSKKGRSKSWGYNGFPIGINDEIDERHVRPTKYLFSIHAETNAIIAAAHSGISLKNSVLICTMFPCANCAANIVQAGIKMVICNSADLSHPTYKDHHEYSKQILKEGGVKLRIIV